jgi:type I restriction enzyme S subunit
MSDNSSVLLTGWRDVTFGELLAHRRERGHNDDPLLSVTGQRGVVPHVDAGRRDTSNADKSAYWRVYPGDIAYNSMRMWQGVSGRSDYFGIVSPAYTVCAPTDMCDSAFAAYLLKQPCNIAAFRSRSQGLVSDTWNLKYGAFSSIHTRVPKSKAEQRRIAELLDTVDAAIGSTERLIGKLALIRQGLVDDLLTLGLDDNGHLRTVVAKDGFHRSRYGQFPVNWTISPLSAHIASIDAGNSPDVPDVPGAYGQWAVLKVSAVRPDGLRSGENKALVDQSRVNTMLEIRDGDLLMTRANTPKLVGLACFVSAPPSRLLLSDKTLRLNLDSRRAVPQFAALVLQSHLARKQIEVNGTGSSGSMKNISQREIREIVLVWPSVSEQRRIVDCADAASRGLSSNRARLTKLKHIKLGLMDDLLTGRVYVREHNAGNP